MNDRITVSRSKAHIKALLAVTFPHYRGRKITVESYTGPRLWQVCWDGGSRDSVRLVTMEGMAVAQAGAPWTNPLGVMAELDQPAGSILVVNQIVSGCDAGIRIIVREPDQARIADGLIRQLTA